MEKQRMMTGLILGLGNEILCDDAIGIRLARRLADSFQRPGWDVEWAEIGPLETMERLVGRDAAILIDSIRVAEDPPGTVYSFSADELPQTSHLRWSHGIDLVTALQLGQDQGYRLPGRLWVVAVNITDNYTLSETMTAVLEEDFETIFREVEGRVHQLVAELALPR
jgi:hydrogenase maturation protease